MASLNPKSPKNLLARSTSRTTIVQWSKCFTIASTPPCVPTAIISRVPDSSTRSDQQVPITPDPGTDDAGQVTEVRKDHIGFGRFEAKLDSSGHRYEAFFERRRERPLVEVGEPEGDCRSGQTHDRARPRKPIGACRPGQIVGKYGEQPGSRYQQAEEDDVAVKPLIQRSYSDLICRHFFTPQCQGNAPIAAMNCNAAQIQRSRLKIG